jgi:rubrerythrin
MVDKMNIMMINMKDMREFVHACFDTVSFDALEDKSVPAGSLPLEWVLIAFRRWKDEEQFSHNCPKCSYPSFLIKGERDGTCPVCEDRG